MIRKIEKFVVLTDLRLDGRNDLKPLNLVGKILLSSFKPPHHPETRHSPFSNVQETLGHSLSIIFTPFHPHVT